MLLAISYKSSGSNINCALHNWSRVCRISGVSMGYLTLRSVCNAVNRMRPYELLIAETPAGYRYIMNESHQIQFIIYISNTNVYSNKNSGKRGERKSAEQFQSGGQKF